MTRSYWGKAQAPELGEQSVNVGSVPCVDSSIRSPILILFLVYLNKDKKKKTTVAGNVKTDLRQCQKSVGSQTHLGPSSAKGNSVSKFWS